jgi:hypothetical protein
MTDFKIFELTGQSALGTHSFKIRATSSAQAQGIADAAISDRNPGLYVRTWTVNEVRTACFTHEGCDGADNTHEALKDL